MEGMERGTNLLSWGNDWRGVLQSIETDPSDRLKRIAGRDFCKRRWISHCANPWDNFPKAPSITEQT